MPTPLAGPGQNLPYPQNLYPSELNNAPYDTPTNSVALAMGQVLPIPAGNWYISTGMYSILQFNDPITGIWRMTTAPGWVGGPIYVKSDGFNYRLANLTGCPVSASVKAYGSGYVQASTTLTAVGNTSTWQPIVGGQLSSVGTFSIDVPNKGGGYGIAPILLIAPPPAAAQNPNGVGGIPASGYVNIASGTVTGYTLTNPGAGYPSAPAAVLVPSPLDPNLATGITTASVTFSVIGSGSITGVLCTNPGTPFTTPTSFSLVLAGAGSSGSVVANVLQTCITASVTGVGIGYGSQSGAGAVAAISVGGGPNAGTIVNNPEFLNLAFRPRPSQISFVSGGAGGTLATQLGTILDGGLFLTTPTFALAMPNGSALTTTATLAFTMGGTQDLVTLQPAP